MPKNIKGGNKSKGMKNHIVTKRVCPRKEGDGEYYARVIKNNGNRFIVKCEDSIERTARMRGAMRNGRRGTWINMDDLVLISLRGFGSDNECDLIFKYNNDEKRLILNETPELRQLFTDCNVNGDNDEDVVQFGGAVEDKQKTNTDNINQWFIPDSNTNAKTDVRDQTINNQNSIITKEIAELRQKELSDFIGNI